jgi:hypothetical protein
MNRVRSLLDKYDVLCDYDKIFGVKGIRWLKSLKLCDNDQIILHRKPIFATMFLGLLG